ncbi:MAG TPA: hypothetical protein VFT72_06375 [Opitutaceae bacterium]|nr:hypothetical protein [Opitutaceae bacterium]
MSAVETIPHPLVLRESLQSFWHDSLEMAETPRGLEFTMPQSYPDGWQIVLRLELPTPTTARLSDGGKTLWQLAQTGQNIEADVTAQRIEELCKSYELRRDGWELFRFLPWPTPGADIHLFTEALVSIAHLNYLHEPAAKTPNVARETVEKVFRERKIDVKTNHRLEGRVEKRIIVDYFASPYRSLAVQVLGRRGAVTSYMEQWGFRWRDLRDAHPRLLQVMLYDPAVQEVDSTATAIGESVCDYFGPYDNVTRLHDLLDLASR